jgi:hypothetical protein
MNLENVRDTIAKSVEIPVHNSVWRSVWNFVRDSVYSSVVVSVAYFVRDSVDGLQGPIRREREQE